MDVGCLVNAAVVEYSDCLDDDGDDQDQDDNEEVNDLVTTLGKWQRKNMTTVEMRMMARLQSRDC